MTNNQRKQWLLDNGFKYVSKNQWNETFEKFVRFPKSKIAKNLEEFLFMVKVYVSLTENEKPYAELFAGPINFISKRCDYPHIAIEKVIKEFEELLNSLQEAMANWKSSD